MTLLASAALLLCLLAVYANGQSCPNGNSNIKESDRQWMTDKHNEFRALTANGKAVNADGSTLPGGKLFKLTYDCTLEAQAQANAENNAANGCQMDHLKPNPFGENLATGYGKQGSDSYTSEVFPTSIQMWYDELKKPGYFGSLDKYSFNSGIGHWSAVVWGKTKRVGCGVAKCGSEHNFDTGNGILTKSIIACEYWPAGNSPSALYDASGSACQQDSDCGAGATCNTNQGLCVDASANAQTQLPSQQFILSYVKPRIDFNDPAVKAVINGYSTSGDGTVTYSTWNGCQQDGCSVPNGLAGTCGSNGKCVDPNWTKAGCWAC